MGKIGRRFVTFDGELRRNRICDIRDGSSVKMPTFS